MNIGIVLILISFVIGCKPAASRLTLSSIQLHPGETITIKYKPIESKTSKIVNLKAKAIFFDSNIKFKAEEIALKFNNSTWDAKITIPQTAVHMSIHVDNGVHRDNNERKGYLFPLLDKKFRPLRGTGIVESYIFHGEGMRLSGIKPDDERALKALTREFKYFPKDRSKYLLNYYILLKTLKSYGHSEVSAVRRELISKFDYITEEHQHLQIIGVIAKENSIQGDSLSAIIRRRFPNGLLVMTDNNRQFHNEKDPEQKVMLFHKLKERFGKGLGDTDNYIFALAMAFGNKKDYTSFKNYISWANDETKFAMKYNSLAYRMALSSQDLDFAAYLSKRSLQLIESIKKNYVTNNQQQDFSSELQDLERQYYMFNDTYSLILYKLGDIKGALEGQQKVFDYCKGKIPEVNEHFAMFLSAYGKENEAKRIIESAIKKRKSTVKMLDQLKVQYIKEHSGDTGYQEYLARLFMNANYYIDK